MNAKTYCLYKIKVSNNRENMKNLLTQQEISEFKTNGAVALRQVFGLEWIQQLRQGIESDLKTPSPRLVSHTKDKSTPAYYEDFWSWHLFDDFKDFVFSSPASQIAAELLDAESINLVMDNWFMREAGSSSSAPFHHDISYFDFEGSMCVLWLPLQAVKKEEGIAWVKGSHLWDKLFIRTRFADGHKVDGEACVINGKKYETTPNILTNKDSYDFLEWDLELGDCVMFDIRTLHGTLHPNVPEKTVQRYTLRMAKEGAVIDYRGDWAKGERAIFEKANYKNGDSLEGEMFPQLWPRVD